MMDSIDEKRESRMKRATANRKLQIEFAGITEQIIREKAYEIWQQTGANELESWLIAEKLLKG